MREIMQPRKTAAWKEQAWAAAAELANGGREILRPPGACTSPNMCAGCYSAARLDLVTVRFDFVARSELVPVRLQRGAMVAMIRALRNSPLGFVVGYGGTGSTASYRTCALQAELYERYQAGIGGKAAPPGASWHNRGVAIDAPHKAVGGRALGAQGWHVGRVSGDPSHCTWRVIG